MIDLIIKKEEDERFRVGALQMPQRVVEPLMSHNQEAVDKMDMRVIIKFNRSLRQITNSHLQHYHQNHNHHNDQAANRQLKCPHQQQLSTLSQTKPPKCMNRAAHYQSKPLSLIIFASFIILLSNYLTTLTKLAAYELPQTNLSFLNQEQQHQPPPPSQLFLPPVNPQQPVTLVNGFNQKRPEEEEDGFIMQASSSVAQYDNSTTLTTDNKSTDETTTTILPLANQRGAEVGETIDEDQNQQQDEERIPIDANRQQFVTHDQLSLLNASTKDESINLTGGSGSSALSSSDEEDEAAAAAAANRAANEKKAPTSRSGMSKVSHVSSFLSDLFAYATRPRPQSSAEESFIAGGSQNHQRQQLNPQAATTTTTTTTTNRPQLQQQQQQVSINTCPGVCRSFLTASILCRNEINAPCPSLLQRCCDKDDVSSFNGTPVETSAPLTNADSEPISAPLSDSAQQTQESSSTETIQQTQPPTSSTSTTKFYSPTTSASTSSKTTPNSTLSNPSPTTGSSSGAQLQQIGSPATVATTTETTAGNKTNFAPSIDLQLGSSSQPNTIYFLSSGNGSSEHERSQQATSGGDKKPQFAEKLQPNSGEEQQQAVTRNKQSASQSFDSPLDEDKVSSSPAQDNKQKAAVVVLQTANGTIIHHHHQQQVVNKPRPSYANWTDYHLSILHNRPQQNSGAQSVVYHSNIDPVKRFVGQNQHPTNLSSSTPTSTSTQIPINTQTTAIITTTTSQPDLNQAPVSMSSIKRTLALPSTNQDLDLQQSDKWQNMEERDSQLKVKVMNDQHSGTKRPESVLQQAANQPLSQTSFEDHSSSTQTTSTQAAAAPAVDNIAGGENDQNENQQQQPVAAGVGNVIAELIDSWISSSSSSHQSGSNETPNSAASADQEDQTADGRRPPPVAPLDAHPTNQLATFASPDQPMTMNDQQNDRRLGYDPSFRQQQPSRADPAVVNTETRPTGAEATGLMTSDGTNEQALTSSSSLSLSTNDQSDQVIEAKCNGYCTIPLFTMLCDSTYRSADCGSSQKCCITGRPEVSDIPTSGSSSSTRQQQQQQSEQDSRSQQQQQQQATTCQGTCLRVYHSSLCTKPNEIQVDAPGCLTGFVCCASPATVSDGTNHLEEIDGMLGAGSSSIIDQNTGHQSSLSDGSYLVKDNSLFASLLPPPPPTISQQLAGATQLNEQQQLQLVQEKNTMQTDPLIVASTRQRQGAGGGGLMNQQDQLYQLQLATTRAPNPQLTTKTSQSSGGSGGGGIMSHLYQMFKSNGSNKQRQRTQQQQQLQQQQQQQQQFQLQQQLQYPTLNYMPQIYAEAYQQSQLQQQRVPSPQQLVFPVQNMMQQQQQQQQHIQPFYSMNSDTSGLIDMQTKQQQMNSNQNRNRVYGNGLPVLRDQQNSYQHVASMQQNPPLPSVSMNQKSGYNPAQTQQHKIPYQANQNVDSIHQHQQQFNENSQLYGEKFVNDQTLLQSFNGQNSNQQHSIKPMSNNQQHPQVAAKQQQQVPQKVSGQHSSSVQQQHQQQQQQPMANGLNFNSPIGAQQNLNNLDRQRYHQSTSPVLATATGTDNAHLAPFVHQATNNNNKQQYYPQQQQQQQQPFTAVGEHSNIREKHQISNSKVEPQQSSVGQNSNRPAIGGNGNTPVRSPPQQQPPQQPVVNGDQRQHAIAGGGTNGNRNGQVETAGVLFEQQKPVWRQNAVSRFPATGMTVADASLANSYEMNESNIQHNTRAYPATASITQNSPVVTNQQTGNWLSMTHQESQPVQQQQNHSEAPNRRVNRPTATATAVAVAGNKASGLQPTKFQTTGPSVTSTTESATYLASPSPNINALINNGAFIDLQRFESNNNLEASRRQLLVGGSPQQQLAAAIGVDLTDFKDDRRIRVPQQQQVMVATALNNQDDLNHSSASTNSQVIPFCPSSCLAPFVSFNCIKPNYIDENFACTSPGSVCCVKKAQTSTTKLPDGTQQPPVAVSQPITTQLTTESSALDNNDKLDLSADSDDQLDEMGKQQQHQSGAESQPIDDVSDAAGSGGLAAASSSVDEQSTAPVMKPKVQASACGVPGSRRRATSGRVMGGFEAKPGHWCWQAALMNNKNEYLCGGALIGSKWVLTAAHCITQHLRSETQLFVRLGQHNLNTTTQSPTDRGAKNIQVKTSYVHHNHNGITLDNDIALLRLEEAVDQDNPAICTVCLPERSSQMEPGKRCVVTGYGFEDENGPAVLRVKQAELPIVADQECQKKTGAVLGKPFALPASSFCAGGELGQDACHGDGGSPLSCMVDGYYELTGIVSWGYKCGSKDLPGLYSKVSTFVGWINQIVSVNN